MIKACERVCECCSELKATREIALHAKARVRELERERDEAVAKAQNIEIHARAIAKAADGMRAHEKRQDEIIRDLRARAEKAERDRDLWAHHCNLASEHQAATAKRLSEVWLERDEALARVRELEAREAQWPLVEELRFTRDKQ